MCPAQVDISTVSRSTHRSWCYRLLSRLQQYHSLLLEACEADRWLQLGYELLYNIFQRILDIEEPTEEHIVVLENALRHQENFDRMIKFVRMVTSTEMRLHEEEYMPFIAGCDHDYR